SRSNSLGRPGERTRAAILEATLLIERGLVDGLLPGCSRGGDRPAPVQQVTKVVQHEVELPVPDGNPEPREAVPFPDHLAGHRAAEDLADEDRLELRAAGGVDHGEPELLALGVLARVNRRGWRWGRRRRRARGRRRRRRR